MTEVALVLLPGLDGTGVLFRPLLAHLPSAVYPIVVSYPPDEPKDYAAMLPLVLKSLPQDKPFVILGESFSGPLAVMAAAGGPSGLRGVILCASFVRNPLWFRPRWLRHVVPPQAFKFFRVLSPIKTLLGGYSSRELRRLLYEALAPVQPRVLACRARAVLGVDVREQLRACRTPVLYLRGQKDRVVPRQNVCDVLGIAPDARVVELPAPHLVLQTHPDEAAQAIAGFVKAVSGTS